MFPLSSTGPRPHKMSENVFWGFLQFRGQFLDWKQSGLNESSAVLSSSAWTWTPRPKRHLAQKASAASTLIRPLFSAKDALPLPFLWCWGTPLPQACESAATNLDWPVTSFVTNTLLHRSMRSSCSPKFSTQVPELSQKHFHIQKIWSEGNFSDHRNSLFNGI